MTEHEARKPRQRAAGPVERGVQVENEVVINSHNPTSAWTPAVAAEVDRQKIDVGCGSDRRRDVVIRTAMFAESVSDHDHRADSAASSAGRST